jgi:hypothetical protein
MLIAQIYGVQKKNESLSFLAEEMELEDVMVSEISNMHKDKCHVLSHVEAKTCLI